MIFAVVPWAEIFAGSSAEPYSWQLDWWFPQLAMLFVVAAIIIGVLAGLREKELSGAITKGASEFLYPALVIVLARGVSVLMNNMKITDTVLHAMEKVATGVSKGLFEITIFVVNLPIAFLIPSTSGPRDARDADPCPPVRIRARLTRADGHRLECRVRLDEPVDPHHRRRDGRRRARESRLRQVPEMAVAAARDLLRRDLRVRGTGGRAVISRAQSEVP